MVEADQQLKFRCDFSDIFTVQWLLKIGLINMKLKFLFFSAILFFFLGKHYHGELIFYFFSVQMLILYVAVFFYKREMKLIARYNEKFGQGDESEQDDDSESEDDPSES